jgi:hypothetical protein
MRLAIRHRLGLLPFDSLARQSCVCKARTVQRFADDPDHFHSCSRHRRNCVTVRHNNLCSVLMDLAHLVGFHAVREPNAHVRPPEIAALPANSEKYNQHADLLLLKHDLKLYIDVTVVRPSSTTVLKNHPRIENTPLVATIHTAKTKHTKYDAIARVNDYTMIPFVLESYGGFGKEAVKLLLTLAGHSKEYTPKQFLTHAYHRLSVALQSSNANLALQAMQQFNLEQHSGSPLRHAARRRDRTADGHVTPIDTDRLAQRVLPQIAGWEAEADEESECPASSPPFVHDSRIAFVDVDPDLRRLVSA